MDTYLIAKINYKIKFENINKNKTFDKIPHMTY